MKDDFEKHLTVDTFRMESLLGAVEPEMVRDRQMGQCLKAIAGVLSENHYRAFVALVLRNVFLIELARDRADGEGDTTKFRVRWYKQLNDSPRYCSFEECWSIAGDIFKEAADSWIGHPERLRMLELFFDYSILPYESPIDYATRDFDHIHRRGEHHPV